MVVTVVLGRRNICVSKKNSRVNGIYDNLSNNLRFLRMLKGMSQEQISEKVHMSRRHYCECENGAAVPSLVTVCILADFYDVPLDDLIALKISYSFADPEDSK